MLNVFTVYFLLFFVIESVTA